MGRWFAALRRSVRPLALNAALLGVTGCALLPPNSFLDPTKVGRFGLDPYEGGIRRVLTPRDTPPGLANATEPTPEDMAPVYEDYRIAPGDAVAIVVQDLLAPGQPYNAVTEVSPLGEVRMPEVGTVRLAGLTEQEGEQEIGARLKDAAILPQPIVQIFPQQRRGRLYSIIGAVAQPGAYPIPDPDFRLLDAVSAAGDIAATSKKLYVIRRTASAYDGSSVTPASSPPTAPAAPESPLVVPPPDGFSEGTFASGYGLAQDAPSPGADTPETLELKEVAAPPPGQAATGRSPFEPIIFDPQTGELLEAPTATAPTAPDSGTAPGAPDARVLDQPFDWNDLDAPALQQRVIGIDVNELKNGNPRFNIVVRNRDTINVPTDTGVFYVVGEVNRPGVYAFGGRDITVKQALAIVGGFSPLAWPGRCEVIRREPGTDKQLIMTVNLDAVYAGLEDDFYLRDDDIVNVGTHIVAPFLFVIRNSFRFTYGFGFVYDRNFADRDSYGSRINPEIIEQQRRSQRGLPF